MPFLEVRSLNKYAGERALTKDVSLSMHAGDKLAIAGETGSGKSTLLKMIGGLLQPDSGEVRLEGERVPGPFEKLLPGHPRIAYLSQHFELRPNFFVHEVLSYANQLSEAEARQLYELCEITHLLDRKTHDALSGGERQRIALARLLTTRSSLLLLDEPFSNLDWGHKQIMQQVVDRIGQALSLTVIMVSHDARDFLPWAETVCIMHRGRLIQTGSPESVYRNPLNAYAAGLTGPFTEVAEALLRDLQIQSEAAAEAGRIMRPENFSLVPDPDGNGLAVTCEFMGPHYLCTVLLNAGKVLAYSKGKPLPVPCRVRVAAVPEAAV